MILCPVNVFSVFVIIFYSATRKSLSQRLRPKHRGPSFAVFPAVASLPAVTCFSAIAGVDAEMGILLL